MIARTSRWLSPFPAAAFRLDTPTQRIHEIDDFGRLTFAGGFNLLAGLLLLRVRACPWAPCLAPACALMRTDCLGGMHRGGCPH